MQGPWEAMLTFSEDAELKDARQILRMQGYPWESCSSLLCGLTVGAFFATADLQHEHVPQRWPRERPRNGRPSKAKSVPYFNALTVGGSTRRGLQSPMGSRLLARGSSSALACCVGAGPLSSCGGLMRHADAAGVGGGWTVPASIESLNSERASERPSGPTPGQSRAHLGGTRRAVALRENWDGLTSHLRTCPPFFAILNH